MKERVIFIVGPTASGKTGVAAALARRLNAEIVSLDSMQIYRGMDVITSKPAEALLKKIPHHLISTCLPTKEYNVSRYRREAMQALKGIIKRRRMPLFTGGTGLYLSVLLDGIFKTGAADEAIRSRLYALAEVRGSSFLHARLKQVDPEAAARIHPNDTKRTVRALEVFEACGRPISQLQKERKGLWGEYDIRVFCLSMGLKELYARIDKRVDAMFSKGLVREAKRLLKLKLGKTAAYAIGLRELSGYFTGVYGLEEARQLMKKNTRNYARRQLTWFRKDKRIEWIQVGAGERPASIAARILKRLT